MFDIGASEIFVIGVVALIVIGPERLPRVARTLGHLFGRLQRRWSFRICVVVEEQIHAETIRLAIHKLNERRTKTRNGSRLVSIATLERVLGRVEEHSDHFAFVGAVENGDSRFL